MQISTIEIKQLEMKATDTTDPNSSSKWKLIARDNAEQIVAFQCGWNVIVFSPERIEYCKIYLEALV